MGHKILVINKDFQTDDLNRKGVNDLIERFLKEGGHEYVLIQSVGNVNSEEYSKWDCVFAHVPPKELKKLETLAKTFPEVGLIITTGDHHETSYQQLSKDVYGRYFLPKPFVFRTFEEAVKQVVSQARNNC